MGLTSRIAQSVGVDVALHGSMELINHQQIAGFLKGCDAHDVHVLGIEGFRVREGWIEPDLNAILDCSYVSDRNRSRAEARAFIERMATTDLSYDFVFREG